MRAVKSNTNGLWSAVDHTRRDGEDSLYLKTSEGDRQLLRYEARLKSRRLLSFGLTTLAQVDEKACWAALSARWESSRHSEPFRTGGPVQEALKDLEPRSRASVLALLAARENGLTPAGSPRTIKKHEKLAREAGLVPGKPLAGQGGELRFLDIWSGEERPV